jgi:hypothetical protein
LTSLTGRSDVQRRVIVSFLSTASCATANDLSG